MDSRDIWEVTFLGLTEDWIWVGEKRKFEKELRRVCGLWASSLPKISRFPSRDGGWRNEAQETLEFSIRSRKENGNGGSPVPRRQVN